MGNYISDIASRNVQNDTPFMKPSTPFPSGIDEGIIPDLSVETVMEENQQITSAPKSTIPVQSDNWNQPNNETNIKKIETPTTEKSTELNYISRHIERLSKDDKSYPIKDDPQETEYVKPLKNKKTNIDLESNKNVSPSTKKIISTMIPDKEDNKSQVISNDKKHESDEQKNDNFSPQVEQQKKISPVINSYELTRITPSQPALEKNVALNNKSKQEKPKLVIGKIIVEVLPPEKQAPPRVINKVVRSTSDNNNSKMNKLSFGLGQL